jgi:hypothetical protein
VSLYVAAFVLMLAAGVLVAAGSPPFGDYFDQGSLRLLRISMWASGAAIVLAAASVLAPRRR